MSGRLRVAAALGLALALVTAACGDDAEPETEESVSVFGLWRGDEAARFAASMEPFEDATGIDVKYVGSANLEADLVNRLDQGTRPDVAFVAQPGLTAKLAGSGDIQPLSPELAQLVENNYIPEWVELGRVDGELYGIGWEVDVKSLVWYPPKVFREAGYEVPENAEQLIALTDQIAADGVSPWCVGMSDFSTTGWVATDWVEDMLLRGAGPDVYDQWVAHEIPFDSDEAVTAVDLFGRIAREPDRILGQPDSWLTTPVGDAPLPLLENPPRCMLHRQASFAERYFGPDVDISPDGDVWFFPFPLVGERTESAVVVGGQMAVMLNATPEASAFMEYLATPASTEGWTASGGFVPAHKSADRLAYASTLDKAAADLVAGAEVLRFDGSDLMVPEVGAGTFWAGMVDYLSGSSAADVLAEIERTWPEE